MCRCGTTQTPTSSATIRSPGLTLTPQMTTSTLTAEVRMRHLPVIGLFAAFMSFIDPTSFNLDASVLLLSMVVIGGARTLLGSIVGPPVVLALPQVITLIDLPTTVAAPMRQLVYGVILIAFMLFRSQGLFGERL